MGLAENLEVLNLRAIAGEYDLQERHTDIAKIPVFLENQGAGSTTASTLIRAPTAPMPRSKSTTATTPIPKLRKWLRNVDFRRALSMGIDRDQLNETFWLGVGSPGTVAPDPSVPHSPGEEWRTMWATRDVDQANQLLDEIGLTEKDGDGFRLRTDNGERLRLETFAIAGAFVPFPRIAESIAQQWQDIGIQLDVSELERNLAFTRMRNNEHQIFMWANDGSELIYAFPRHALPVDPVEAMMGPLIALWYVSNGEEGDGADRRGDADGDRALHFGRRTERRGEQRDRPGDLEAHRRQRLQHRHGRCLAGGDGHPDRQEQHGQHPGPPGQHAARPHAAKLAPGDLLLQGGWRIS